MNTNEKALALHEEWNGKITTEPKCHVRTREDLALAYTPGVAEPCKKIAKNKDDVYRYTIKSNTIAVVSDGSAVLGLGNIGPEAAMPVMEGKAVLFKEFGNVNAFPICLDTQDTEEIIETVIRIAPAFGGINLEDISAPRCFEIERKLKECCDIPIFHDDQHGTAIVVAAAGSLPADLERLWVTDAPNSYNMEYGASCMGYEIAGAFGAKLAEPDKEVYALVGDGSFMMLNSEIPTAMQENAKITVVVFDNCAFGCINNLQMGNGVGSLATEMRHRNETTGKLDGDYCYTDFGKIGEGFGMKAFYAKTPDEFRKAVQDAKKESVSCIIDAKVLPKTMAEGYESWWHIGVASTSKSDEVKAARKRIDDHLAEARMY